MSYLGTRWGSLTLCREAVGVFYSPSQLGKISSEYSFRYIYIYIYIYTHKKTLICVYIVKITPIQFFKDMRTKLWYMHMNAYVPYSIAGMFFRKCISPISLFIWVISWNPLPALLFLPHSPPIVIDPIAPLFFYFLPTTSSLNNILFNQFTSQ